MTTRIYDNDLVERFNVSVGQIYSFTPSRTGVNQTNKEDDTGSRCGRVILTGKSAIAGAYAVASIRYAAGQRFPGNAIVEYRRDADRMVQLSYRYSSPEYVAQALSDSGLIDNPSYQKICKNGISQVGATASWPIADAWSLVGLLL